MKVTVNSAKGDEVSLRSVAAFEEVTGPAAVYRVNLYPSVRISGFSPKGKTAAEAAAKWVDLAKPVVAIGVSRVSWGGAFQPAVSERPALGPDPQLADRADAIGVRAAQPKKIEHVLTVRPDLHLSCRSKSGDAHVRPEPRDPILGTASKENGAGLLVSGPDMAGMGTGAIRAGGGGGAAPISSRNLS